MNIIYSAAFQILGLTDDSNFLAHIETIVNELVEVNRDSTVTSFNGVGARINKEDDAFVVDIVFLGTNKLI